MLKLEGAEGKFVQCRLKIFTRKYSKQLISITSNSYIKSTQCDNCRIYAACNTNEPGPGLAGFCPNFYPFLLFGNAPNSAPNCIPYFAPFY